MKSSQGHVLRAGTLFLFPVVTYTSWTNKRYFISPQFLPCLKDNTFLMLVMCYCKRFNVLCWKHHPKQQKMNVLSPCFFFTQLQAGGTAFIYSNFLALLKTYISRGQTDISSSAIVFGSAFLSPSFPLSCQALVDGVEQARMAGKYSGNFPLPKDFFSCHIFWSVKAMQCTCESTCRAGLVLSSELTDLAFLPYCDSRECLVPGPYWFHLRAALD